MMDPAAYRKLYTQIFQSTHGRWPVRAGAGAGEPGIHEGDLLDRGANWVREHADVIGFLVGFTPISDAKDMIEAITGHDLITGEQLSLAQRATLAAGAALPFVSGKMLKGAMDFMGGAVEAAMKKGAKNVDDAAGSAAHNMPKCPDGGPKCFVAGTQVLVLVPSNAHSSVIAASQANPSGERDWLLPALIVGAGLAGWKLDARRRKKQADEENELEELMRQLFDPQDDLQVDAPDCSPNWNEGAFDDAVDELAMAIAADGATAVWRESPAPPPRVGIRRLEPTVAPHLSRRSSTAPLREIAELPLPRRAETRDANPVAGQPSARGRKTRTSALRAASGSRPGRIWLAACVAIAAIIALRPAQDNAVANRPFHAAVSPAPEYAYRNIEDIRAGDFVLSRAEGDADGAFLTGRVGATFERQSRHLRILTLRNADGSRQTLKTTNEHPFWVEDRGWVEARNLLPGDRLTQSDQGESVVEATDYESHPEGVAVYNFRVEDLHTYFVAAPRFDGLPILVHNAAGVYEFPDQQNPGQDYVGQSSDMDRRVKEHEASGRSAPGTATQTPVSGSRTDREVAEHNRIQNLTGGQTAGNSPAVSNKKDPVGPNRRPGLGLPDPTP